MVHPVFICKSCFFRSIVKATANPRLLFMAGGLLFDIWGSVGGEVRLGMVVMVCLLLLLLLDWMIPTGEYRQILGWMLSPILCWRQETCTELWSPPTHHNCHSPAEPQHTKLKPHSCELDVLCCIVIFWW